ncbi:MAG: twin-arginine translocase subunit TatB [Alphaproteobacteria bacterium]|nr:twin-arginine translocase subunit TatB [Alphaproteobacteria bacterium]
MFDFGLGYTEIFVIVLVAIIVIGPKDLPRVLRALGKTVAKMRGMAREFQGHLDGAMKDAGLDEVKKEFQNLKEMGKDIGTIDPVKKTPQTDSKKAEEDFKTFFGEPEKPAASAGDSRPAA